MIKNHGLFDISQPLCSYEFHNNKLTNKNDKPNYTGQLRCAFYPVEKRWPNVSELSMGPLSRSTDFKLTFRQKGKQKSADWYRFTASPDNVSIYDIVSFTRQKHQNRTIKTTISQQNTSFVFPFAETRSVDPTWRREQNCLTIWGQYG